MVVGADYYLRYVITQNYNLSIYARDGGVGKLGTIDYKLYV